MKINVIIRHEYLSRVKSKGFIISSLIMPFMMAILLFLPHYLMRFQSDEIKKIIISDSTGTFFEEITQELAPDSLIQLIADPDLCSIEKLQEKVYKEKAFGFVIIPADVETSSRIFFYSINPANFSFARRIEQTISRLVIKRRTAHSDYDPQIMQQIMQNVNMETYKITKTGRATKDRGAGFGLAYILGFTLYLTILIYGMMVMNSIIEEKTSRIYEVILSSIRPFPLLTGKLIGISLLGLTQFLFWIAFGFFLWRFIQPAAGASQFNIFDLSGIAGQIHPSLWFFFVFYFTAGYFCYSALYSIIGAAVNNQTEAQNLQTPITLTIVFSFLFMFFVINNPNSSLSIILSILPLTAPILMMVRLSIQFPPLWQIALSVSAQIIGFLAIIWIAAKIYRIGILMYGKPPTFKELFRWIKEN